MKLFEKKLYLRFNLVPILNSIVHWKLYNDSKGLFAKPLRVSQLIIPL